MHISDDDLALYVRGRLDNPLNLESHIKACVTCRDKLSGTARFIRDISTLSRFQKAHDESDKRKEPRIPTDEIASMHVLSPLRFDREQVRILDVSRNGVKIRVATLIEPGSIVQLRLEHTHVLGEVRYCVKAEESGFNAGILIQDMQQVYPKIRRNLIPLSSRS